MNDRLAEIKERVADDAEWSGMQVYHRDQTDEGHDPEYATYIAARDFEPHREDIRWLVAQLEAALERNRRLVGLMMDADGPRRYSR